MAVRVIRKTRVAGTPLSLPKGAEGEVLVVQHENGVATVLVVDFENYGPLAVPADKVEYTTGKKGT